MKFKALLQLFVVYVHRLKKISHIIVKSINSSIFSESKLEVKFDYYLIYFFKNHVYIILYTI